jgi:hypothetical protein
VRAREGVGTGSQAAGAGGGEGGRRGGCRVQRAARRPWGGR